MFNEKNGPSSKYSVRTKLLTAILLTSSAVTLVLTCFQLGTDYVSDIGSIQKRMEEIRVGRSGVLAQALWQLDANLIDTGLQGLLSVQDLVYAEITESLDPKGTIGKGQYKRGTYDGTQDLLFSEPLYHVVEKNEESSTLKAGQKILLGHLNVVFTKSLIYSRLEYKAIFIMATQAFKTFVVSMLIMFFIRILVTQHLSTMAAYFNRLDARNLSEPLRLNKKRNPPTDQGEPNLDELDYVADAINQMIEKIREAYEAQRQHQEHLRELNASLDQRVKEQTAQLAEEKRQIKMLLDNMSQAVFRVGDDMKVVGPISRHSDDLFGEPIDGHNVFDLLFSKSSLNSGQQDTVREVLEVCFHADSLQWDLNSDNLPEKLEFPGSSKSLRVRYSPLFNEADELVQFLFVVEDITKLQKLEEQRLKSQRQIDLLHAFANAGDKERIMFFSACRAQLAIVEEKIRANFTEAGLVECYRSLHTLKGNARMLRFDEIAQATHGFETEVSGVLGLIRSGAVVDVSVRAAATAKLDDLLASITEAANSGVRFFGIDVPMATVQASKRQEAQTLSVLNSSYERLLSLVAGLQKIERTPAITQITADVTRAVAGLTDVSLADGLERIRPMVDEIASRLGKSVDLILGGDPAAIPASALGNIIDIAGHTLRNALDHGIELPDDREQAGKSRRGILRVNWEMDSVGNLELNIADDGRGIDTRKLVKKAQEMGIVKPSQNLSESEKLQLIFVPTLSTTENISDISGRGVGMDAVRSIVHDLGGHIHVETEGGKGTRFIFKIATRMKEFNNLMLLESKTA